MDFDHNYLINFQNNDDKTRDIDSMYIVFEQKDDLLENDTLFLGSYTLPSFSDFDIFNQEINFEYPNTNHDEMNFDINTKLVTDSYDSTCNNVITQHKEMSVFYSYDDGTAENGYGLIGTGTKWSYVAQKYYTYSPDYMTGVKVYFNQTFRNVQPNYFYAVVWAKDETRNIPGEIIYEQSSFNIDHDNLNNFYTFVFEEPVSVADTFFVGWQKLSADNTIMNIGLDINSTNENYKFYNIYGDWQQSSVDGVMMMRPIFGDTDLSDIEKFESEIQIYPNPTNDIVNIQLQNLPENKSDIYVYDFSGKLILNSSFSDDNTSIDLSNYSTGVYFIKIVTENQIINKKIIKN